jgi:hypothetical protein
MSDNTPLTNIIETKPVKKSKEEREAEKQKQKEEKQKQKEEKQKEKQKQKQLLKDVKQKEKENKYLEKTHGFNVPNNNVLFTLDTKYRLAFIKSIYEIIEELAPELLNDIVVKTAYNQFVDIMKQNIEYIWSYTPKDKYDWFQKECQRYKDKNDLTRTIISSHLHNHNTRFSVYLSNFSGINAYYGITSKLKKDTDEYNTHINNIANIYDKYIILWDLISPVIRHRANKRYKSITLAKEIERNKLRIQDLKNAILDCRERLDKYEKELRDIDVEGTTIAELFGES